MLLSVYLTLKIETYVYGKEKSCPLTLASFYLLTHVQILHLQPTVPKFAKAKPSSETKKEKEHWKRNLEMTFPTNKVSVCLLLTH